MSVKYCDSHSCKRRKLFRRILYGIAIFIAIAIITIFLVWAILRPKNPRFILQDATIYVFNVSSPNMLTSSFQVTISSRNPNDKIGIYYDKLDLYATYRDQQITYRASLPTTYQGHKDINVWSPYVSGNAVPVAPYNAVSLSQDQTGGVIPLMFKIDGRVRWKVGTFISGNYRLNVKCFSFINCGDKGAGVAVGNDGVKYQLVQSCSVSV